MVDQQDGTRTSNGLVEDVVNRKPVEVDYKPYSEFCDTEQNPLEGSSKNRFVPLAGDSALHLDVWRYLGRLRIGFWICFTRHYIKPKPMRSLDETSADVLVLDKDTGLLKGEYCESN